ncbi:hypothetical protein CFOL_v3_12090 [Cephalotus follicularis]|uniref:Uncharacterized protein n=1 Tax=Cephalotus follicularis TaxID=3775 RepID=A0A1Q3BKP4_CEPFO|nr:hypothetical protein CFOL_v3_12090 [Cephalotus follicularis]
MNFLIRSTHQLVEDPVSFQEHLPDEQSVQKPSSTLEGLIAVDPFPRCSTAEDRDAGTNGIGHENGGASGPNAKNDSPIVEDHVDVSEEEGWIAVPYNKLPDNWSDAPDIHSLRSHDRSFVFPGEQLHILACLSACKQDTEIITPFKVAAVMVKNGIGKSPKKQNGKMKDGTQSGPGDGEVTLDGQDTDQNGENLSKESIDAHKDISTSESILRMEDHKRKTEILLQKFKNSHFFVRIAESGEPLWLKKSSLGKSPESFERDSEKSAASGTRKSEKYKTHLNALIDRGNFDANFSGGAVRNSVKCCSLSNGDIAVLLQVNVSVDFLKDPIIEILQFEKYQENKFSLEKLENSVNTNHDPCGELLKWLLPLDNSLPPPARPLSPPPISSAAGNGNTSQRSASSGSQLFSFGHFRSYSMSSLPQSNALPAAPVKAQSSKPSFDLEEWDQYSSQKLLRSLRTGSEQLLSFRGVSLERERFSVCCGLEGIYIPGRRWRKKLEIIQPVEIHSFAADCNTDDFLCVQIKNVSPAHAPDIVVYIDAISIVFEEASNGGPPSTLPIACIEAGNDHSLPDLALRIGEEHSFILKPASPIWKKVKVPGERNSQSPSLRLPSKSLDGREISLTTDQYAIMVSCRCNYTESRLFFKQPTSWRPRIPRDLMISVATEMAGQSSGSGGRDSHLPVQVLTLQASNLTSEDLSLTILAPVSFTSPPSVVSLNSSPTSPMSPFVGFSELKGRVGNRQGTVMQKPQSGSLASVNQKRSSDNGHGAVSFNEQPHPIPDVVPSTGLGCSHLWLHSRVPLGRVPSQSTATIKLELLPLTDGIITLDTLQVDVKEKGLTYIPEQLLKINATSSISTGII